VVMIWLTHWLKRTRLIDDTAGLGIVFSAMFSVGILLVSQNLRNTHFHADCIIDGNLALAPLDRLIVASRDFGPKAFVIMSVMSLSVLGFILLSYKELKLMLFDPGLARQFGFRPGLLQFLWLSVVSMTTVAAFEVAGSILIVALMIAPPAAAYLLTRRLSRLLMVAVGLAALSSVGGFFMARWLDVSPTGPIASVSGGIFLLVFTLAPGRGWLAAIRRRQRQRAETQLYLLMEAVARDENPSSGNAKRSLSDRLNWPPRELDLWLDRLLQRKWADRAGNGYRLTDLGLDRQSQLRDRLMGT
ncbi:MAG: iron chelate uptake ABC transporter family permease subunit, partial [Planctomycetota bacterium]